MSMLAVTSASGAPGVTTLALTLGLIWPNVLDGRHAIVVDADPAGSGIVPGYLRGSINPDIGVLSLAAHRNPLTYLSLMEQTVALGADEETTLLPGVTDTARSSALHGVWRAIGELVPELDAAGCDVIVDVGRLGHRHEPTEFLTAASDVVLVTNSTLTGVTHARSASTAIATLRGPGRCCLAVVGQGTPYPAAEIADVLGITRVGAIAEDRSTAEALGGRGSEPRRFERTLLARSVSQWLGSVPQVMRSPAEALQGRTVPAAPGLSSVPATLVAPTWRGGWA